MSKRPGWRSVSGRTRGPNDDDRQADRNVDEQAPPPRQRGRQQATDDQADGRPAAGDRAVHRNRARPGVSLLERRQQQRQCRRCRDRPGDPLNRPSEDQDLGCRCHAGQKRGGREDRHSRKEDPAPAEDVTQPGAEQQQPTEGQRVGVLHPREPGAGEVQRFPDLRQCRHDDRRVQREHQLARKDHDEHQGRRRRLRS